MTSTSSMGTLQPHPWVSWWYALFVARFCTVTNTLLYELMAMQVVWQGRLEPNAWRYA